jgi:hypothetical protein
MYPISKEAKELNIKNTLHNKYNMNKIIKHPTPQKQKQNTDMDPQHQKMKWDIFTYNGKQEKSQNYSRPPK